MYNFFYAENLDISKIKVLYIISKDPVFLMLPWEFLVEKKLFPTVRFLDSDILLTSKPFEYKEVSMLICLSHSGDLIIEDLKSEVREIMTLSLDTEPKFTKIENVKLLNHTSKKTFEKIDTSKINVIHMLMHGDKSNLYFESKDELEDSHKKVDYFSIDELLVSLKNLNIHLIYFSGCDTAGWFESKNNYFTLKVINSSNVKYSIGYFGKVKSKIAIENSKKIYNKYFIRPFVCPYRPSTLIIF